MPTVTIPGQFFSDFKDREIKSSALSLQSIIHNLQQIKDEEFSKFRAFFQLDDTRQYQTKGLLIFVNGIMITDLSCSVDDKSIVSFVPAVSGG